MFWRIFLSPLNQHWGAHAHTHTSNNKQMHAHIDGIIFRVECNLIQALFNAVSTEMSPAVADKLLSRKRKKLKEKSMKIFLL